MMKFEDLKAFDVAALGRDAIEPTGRPCDLPVAKIHPDPENIRTQCSEEAIAELAATIEKDGLIQAITVRPHPEISGDYMISYGERRWRATRSLGRSTIAAVIEPDFDPYRQAIENLQRKDLTALEIATFVARREAMGESRTEIARRLGKPKSFISELAQLAFAPDEVREAVASGRIDTRTAYLLSRHFDAAPEKVTTLLARDASPQEHRQAARELNATAEEAVLGSGGAPERGPARPRKPKGNALAVLISGRTGIMTFGDDLPATAALVRFADGSQESVPLGKITLKHWVRF